MGERQVTKNEALAEGRKIKSMLSGRWSLFVDRPTVTDGMDGWFFELRSRHFRGRQLHINGSFPGELDIRIVEAK
jgi:hypothetical protein